LLRSEHGGFLKIGLIRFELGFDVLRLTAVEVMAKRPLNRIGLRLWSARTTAKILWVDMAAAFHEHVTERPRLSLSAETDSKSVKPVPLVVDRTGLKIFGEGEWLV
tara:strand:- start:216 stop:533 length:318 start_codon:yes stop_codon:yes gene_type:complete